MITVANRATPQPLTLEQGETAMTREGAAPVDPMPASAARIPQPISSTQRPTLSLPHTARDVPVEGKARD